MVEGFGRGQSSNAPAEEHHLSVCLAHPRKLQSPAPCTSHAICLSVLQPPAPCTSHTICLSVLQPPAPCTSHTICLSVLQLAHQQPPFVCFELRLIAPL
jgi:hypothetical protein